MSTKSKRGRRKLAKGKHAVLTSMRLTPEAFKLLPSLAKRRGLSAGKLVSQLIAAEPPI